MDEMLRKKFNLKFNLHSDVIMSYVKMKKQKDATDKQSEASLVHEQNKNVAAAVCEVIYGR